MAETPGLLDTLLAVARALEAAGAPYVVGGSLASSLQGIPRSTFDVDLVADLADGGVEAFLRSLGSRFYADRERVLDGVRRGASFNVIDLETGFKADIYLAGGGPLDRSQFTRRQVVEVLPGVSLPFCAPEDVVLQKLRWYRLGGEVSERQWLDALGVLKVQGEGLDRSYLVAWAAELAVSDLLERALRDAGLATESASGTPEG